MPNSTRIHTSVAAILAALETLPSVYSNPIALALTRLAKKEDDRIRLCIERLIQRTASDIEDTLTSLTDDLTDPSIIGALVTPTDVLSALDQPTNPPSS